MNRRRLEKAVLQAAKIGVGSSAAIWIAEFLGLQNAASAGTIALLTIVATKWETMKLSALRIVTFAAAVALSFVTIHIFPSDWVAYGVYIFGLVIACELVGWKATISVNAVIGAHFLTSQDFGRAFILNEFGLVLIGISIAIVLNLFHHNRRSEQAIIVHMRETEQKLALLLGEMASYLSHREMQVDVWEHLGSLEKQLHAFIADAYDYQGNTFVTHSGYYVDYFEMRMKQCSILRSLHYEMNKLREIPKQAKVIAEYMLYLKDYVVERNVPEEQICRLDGIFEAMKREPLPASREEFENRAILYHVLMDIEDFLYIKKRFVEGMDGKQREKYWGEKEDFFG